MLQNSFFKIQIQMSIIFATFRQVKRPFVPVCHQKRLPFGPSATSVGSKQFASMYSTQEMRASAPPLY